MFHVTATLIVSGVLLGHPVGSTEEWIVGFVVGLFVETAKIITNKLQKSKPR